MVEDSCCNVCLRTIWNGLPILIIRSTPISHHSSYPDWLIYYEQIECNGTYSNFQRAIGQCLYHFLLYGRIPIYLAVPDDYQHLQIIEKILDYFKLPIGILTVNNKGEILTKRETKGKIRWLKLYPSKEGALTAKSTFG